MTKYLYMINWALTCIDKLLKVISERNYLQNYVSRMFYNSCNISILYQTLHRLKDAFFLLFFFYSIYNSKTSPSKIVYAKIFAILGTVVQFYHFFINFFLSLSLVFLSFPSLFSLLSHFSCHTISPKFLPLSLSLFFLSSHWFTLLLLTDGSWWWWIVDRG